MVVGSSPTNYLIQSTIYNINLQNRYNEFFKINIRKDKVDSNNVDWYFFNNYQTHSVHKLCIFFFNAKFKYNHRFTISLIYRLFKLITMSSRNNNKFGSVSKKNRYCIITIFLLKCLNSYTKQVDNVMIYFLYKNTSMQTIAYLKLLYKLFKLVNTSRIFGFVFSLNMSSYPNKCFKKIKTIKKFKKKIFYKIYLNNLKEFYII